VGPFIMEPLPLYYQAAVREARATNRPTANQIGWSFGMLNAVVAFVQIVVSNTTASNYAGPLTALQSVNNTYAGVVPLEMLLPPLVVSVVSAVLGGIINLVFAYLAAKRAARATRDAALGQRAAIIAALVGMFAWAILAAIGPIIGGTDGFALVVNTFSKTPLNEQVSGIVFLATARALILGGLTLIPAWIFGVMGAQAGKDQL
jgi:hypothetical protein